MNKETKPVDEALENNITALYQFEKERGFKGTWEDIAKLHRPTVTNSPESIMSMLEKNKRVSEVVNNSDWHRDGVSKMTFKDAAPTGKNLNARQKANYDTVRAAIDGPKAETHSRPDPRLDPRLDLYVGLSIEDAQSLLDDMDAKAPKPEIKLSGLDRVIRDTQYLRLKKAYPKTFTVSKDRFMKFSAADVSNLQTEFLNADSELAIQVALKLRGWID